MPEPVVTDADRERAAAAAMDAEDRAAAIDALIEGGSELAFRWHWARGAAYRGHQHWTGGVSSEQFIGVDFAPCLAEAIERVRASAYARGRADALAKVRSVAEFTMVEAEEICAQHLAIARAEGFAAGAAEERERGGSRAAYAEFGAWAFEQFWNDAEPGDIDGGDAQEAALRMGLLRRRVVGDEGATCGTEYGCDYKPGDPVSKCECLFVVFAPLRDRAAQEGASDGPA